MINWNVLNPSLMGYVNNQNNNGLGYRDMNYMVIGIWRIESIAFFKILYYQNDMYRIYLDCHESRKIEAIKQIWFLFMEICIWSQSWDVSECNWWKSIPFQKKLSTSSSDLYLLYIFKNLEVFFKPVTTSITEYCFEKWVSFLSFFGKKNLAIKNFNGLQVNVLTGCYR